MMLHDGKMTRQGGAIHVARVVRRCHMKDGESRESVSHLLRRSCREGGRIRHETFRNVLQPPPPSVLDALRAGLSARPS